LSDENHWPFSGVFHGNGKTVSGLKLSGGAGSASGTSDDAEIYAGAMFIGLFGYINGAYIHDLTLEVANTAEERVAYNGKVATGRPSIAALAAVARSSVITDIALRAAPGAGLYATATLTGLSTYTYAGGAVGYGYDTRLANIDSSLPLNVNSPQDDRAGHMTAGGIAGTLTGNSEIKGANMTGTIEAVSNSKTAADVTVGGICADASAIRNCAVTIDSLTLTVYGTGTYTRNASLSGIGGGAAVTDCSVDIGTIGLYSYDYSDSARSYSVGGISAASANGSTIERCRARFDKLEVKGYETALYRNSSYIGGLAGNLGAAGKIINSFIESDGVINVEFNPLSTSGGLNVGGLAGQGNVSRSYIDGAFRIDVKTGNEGSNNAAYVAYVGGLTGNGVAEYSHIGSKLKPATLNVTRINTTSSANNRTYVGGISGQAPLTPALPFRYNYAFCDVTLTTSAGSTNAIGQVAGGLAGNVTGTGSFTECYAVGDVTVYDNFSGNAATKIYAGGIAAYGPNNANLTILKCAALGTVTINNAGTNSNASAQRIWRRVMYPVSNGTATKFINNITGIDTIPTDSNAPADGLNTANGFYVANVTEDTFFETLGWDRDVWRWDAGSGYPVLK
jgi:hypothetical protein